MSLNLETFFESFGHLADAPNGVQKLRELILQLAVQGKLVPQDANDRTSETPLGELLRENSLNGIGIRPNDSPPGVPILRISAGTSRRDGIVDEQDYKFIEIDAETLEQYRLLPGDLLACRFNGNLHFVGKLSLYTGYSNVTQVYPDKLIRFRVDETKCISAYIRYAMNSAQVRSIIEKMCATTAGNIGISATNLKTVPIPIPPLEIQKAIVAKVDQLMALCDELEARQQRQQTARVRLNNAALDRLLTARAPEEFAAHWQRICDNFDLLYDAPETVSQLRQAILQLAVQGKLVSQDAHDEPAAALLAQIKAEKERLIQEKRIRRNEPLPPIEADEVQFDLPKGWEWTRFGTITINRDGERIPLEKSARAIRQGQYDYYGASGVIDKIDGFLFDKSLLLIGEDGANLINRSTPIAFIAHGKYWVNNHAHVLDGISLNFLRYLELFINSIDLKPYVTGTAQPKMNQAKMNSIVVALPPAKEQQRILAKVNQLMALCDELETKLRQAQAHSAKLMTATVQQLAAV